MFVFDLQCCSLRPQLSTDGFNCDFAGMMNSALRKTINFLAHNTMCLWVAEHMERLVGVERGTRCWASVMESFVNQWTTNGVKGVPWWAVLSQDCLVLETKREGERVKGEEVKESNYFWERAPSEPGEHMWDLTYGERSDWPWADEKSCTGVFLPISQPSGGQRQTPASHERHFTVFLHVTQLAGSNNNKKIK